MAKSNSPLFDQALDRAVFITFFLGGIVPLLGLAVLSERVKPDTDAPYLSWALTGAVLATGVLCLVSYLALRRIVGSAVSTMTSQNDRLESLLGVARDLAEAPHPQAAAESAACWAQRLCTSDAS
jgi:hypothetical protein